jgi:hypothetical protein
MYHQLRRARLECIEQGQQAASKVQRSQQRYAPKVLGVAAVVTRVAPSPSTPGGPDQQ